MSTTHLYVNEIFGPTIQGEGPSTGRRAVFLRLAGCNLNCEWCDTSYTWDYPKHDKRAEVTKMPVDEVARDLELKGELPYSSNAILIISGGEPLLQADALRKLVFSIGFLPGWPIEIETNGTRPPIHGYGENIRRDIYYNVSPKLTTSGVTRPAIKDISLRQLAWRGTHARFKFVITGWRSEDILSRELTEIRDIVGRCGIKYEQVWLMPEATTPEALRMASGLVAETAIREGYNFSTRLHIDLWKNERKR